jgi:predicted phage terminase large subunit-like protein
MSAALKRRVRLNDGPGAITPAQSLKGPSAGLLGPSTGNLKAAANITPETLAFALPGGLAKLAYPRWMYAPYIQYIEDRLLPVVTGEKQIFLMFSAPPRHGKTQFISKVLPAWYLGRRPNNRVLLVTYNTDFSKQQGRTARNIFEKFGQQVFGLKVAQDSSSSSHWDIAGHEGGMEAVGAEGSITGKGAHLLIIDDPLKGFEAAMSESTLQRVWEWFITDVYTRLEPGASVIIVMTRWTLYDLIGRIREKQRETAEGKESGEDIEVSFEGWETINFPALATSEDDILGRKPGQALFPQRYSEKDLKRIKSNMDTFWWEALFQGNPVPLSGTMIDINWFKGTGRQYTELLTRDKFEMVIISTDTANKDTELADYTVYGIWGVLDGFYYLLDVVRAKMEFPELLATSKALNAQWRPDFFLIEDKGSGTNLIQVLRAEIDCIRPIDPGSESKILRMSAETPSMRAGKVRLPKDASWLENYLLEARSFPRGKKDQMDMTSQFLRFMRENSSGIQMW